MSYDLAVWAGARPADDQSAAKEFEQRCDQRDADIDRGIDHPPSPVIERFAADLLSRWPELDDDSGDECPWSDAPLIGDASGNFFHFAMTFTGADEVVPYAAEVARHMDLVCYDPQTERLL